MLSYILLSTVVYKSILGRGSDEPQFKDWEQGQLFNAHEALFCF